MNGNVISFHASKKYLPKRTSNVIERYLYGLEKNIGDKNAILRLMNVSVSCSICYKGEAHTLLITIVHP